MAAIFLGIRENPEPDESYFAVPDEVDEVDEVVPACPWERAHGSRQTTWVSLQRTLSAAGYWSPTAKPSLEWEE